jgi:hypothetical protein
VDDLAVGRRLRRIPSPCRVFWLVFAGDRQLSHPLPLSLDAAKEPLAVFSYKEEAEMFIRSGGPQRAARKGDLARSACLTVVLPPLRRR